MHTVHCTLFSVWPSPDRNNKQEASGRMKSQRATFQNILETYLQTILMFSTPFQQGSLVTSVELQLNTIIINIYLTLDF